MKSELELIHDCLVVGVDEYTAIVLGDLAWELQSGAIEKLTPELRACVLAVAEDLGLVKAEHHPATDALMAVFGMRPVDSTGNE